MRPGNLPPVSFRSISRSDFARVSQWLATPHLARWWADDPTLEAIEADYGACIDGTEPAEVFIAHHAGAPLGLIQRYRFDAYPHYTDELSPLLAVPQGAFSIDYFIGPVEALRRGLGVGMIRAFVAKLWQDHSAASSIIVPTHAGNRASWRSLEQAGFSRVASGALSPDNPADDTAHLIYRVDRPVLVKQGAI